MIIGQWGAKTFEVSEDKLFSPEGFASDLALASDEQRDDGGKPATNVKGADLEKINFSIQVGRDYGTDARNEKEDWHKLLAEGTAYPLILDGIPWSQGDFQLKKVGISELVTNGQGTPLRMVLALEFQEWQEQAAAQKKTSANKSKRGASKADKGKAAKENSNMEEALRQGNYYTDKNAQYFEPVGASLLGPAATGIGAGTGK